MVIRFKSGPGHIRPINRVKLPTLFHHGVVWRYFVEIYMI
jgi:hypothetical protein